MGEWAAFERAYGPLLIHERVDYGLAVTAAAAGGGKVVLPPWYPTDDGIESDDALIASLSKFGKRQSFEER